ncbi:fimbrial protein [Silvimonas sp.]|uniref:fimbrial protein n=1 Tax=Silvimonas sp. TaxID=2650811 RepID=UPI00283BCB09|nr:fimbrial protein [Silvimonas sp.]MDR3429863.1 fimbrial protein [Silvimonas sp.]
MKRNHFRGCQGIAMKYRGYLTRYYATTCQSGRSLFTRLGTWCALLALTLVPAIAHADCTSSLGGSAPLVVLVPGFTINTDPSVPIGTVLGTSTQNWSATNPSAYFTCTALMPQSSYNGSGNYLGTVGGTTNVYSTSLPGIGVQLSFFGSSQFPLQMSGTPVSPYHYAPNPSYSLTIKLVKTGFIPAGGAITGEIGQGWISDASGGNQFQYASIQLSSSIIFIPTTPTCIVTAPPVSLGVITIGTTLRNIGDTSAAQNFNVTLVCSGGTGGKTTNIYATLTDQQNPGNASNQLSLTNTSVATGVKIQILNGATVLSYGPDSNVAGNTNQWLVQNAVGNTTLTIPLSARYIQTAASPTPGSANGIATMTLSYQ